MRTFLSLIKNKKINNFDLKIDLKKLLIACIIIGLLLRVVSTFTISAANDAGYYIIRARNVADGNGFYYPFGDPTFSDNLDPVHTATLAKQPFSVYLALFYSAFGSSYIVSQIASILLSFVALLVVYFCTKDIFSKDNALIVLAIFSLDFILIFFAAGIYAENLVFIFFTVALWGMLKSINDEKYIPITLLFVSLFLITKIYLLYIYLPLIFVFYLWLYSFRKKEILRNIWFFLSLVVVAIFAILSYLYERSISDPSPGGLGFSIFFETPIAKILLPIIVGFVFSLIYVTVYIIFFFKSIRISLHEWKDPSNNICLLVIFGLILFTVYMITYIHISFDGPLISRDRLRYLQLAILPIAWLAIKNYNYDLNSKIKFDLRKPFTRILRFLKSREGIFGLLFLIIGLFFLRQIFFLLFLVFSYISLIFISAEHKIFVFFVMLLIVSINTSTGISYSYNKELGMDMNERLNEGDIVAFDSVTFFGVNGENGIDRYILAPYVEGDYILVDYSPNTTVDYIISAEPDNEYNNYTLIKKYYSEDRRGIISVAVETILSPGQSSKVAIYVLWERDEN
jgi:hypothetical protein